MLKKMLLILILTPFLIATTCEDDDCDNLHSPLGENHNLIILTPIQTTYNKGDDLTLKINFPSKNDYFGEEIDIFNTTGSRSAFLSLHSASFFSENTITMIKGNQTEYLQTFELIYNPATEIYELELIITLNRTGQYSPYTQGDIRIENSTPCTNFIFHTDILWSTETGNIMFEVIE